MILVSDIGNTSITIGLFETNILTKILKTDSNIDDVDFYIDYLTNIKTSYNIENSVILSVNDKTLKAFKQACNKVFNIESKVLDFQSFAGMEIDIENPELVGVDRLADVYAIKTKEKYPTVVVDAGTAVTIDILSGNGAFCGGVIIPGINTQLESLNKKTSKLPAVKISKPVDLIGKTTKDAILSGVIRGIAYAIDGFIKQYEIEIREKPLVVLCGGDAEIISEYMNSKIDMIDKNLTLEGGFLAWDTSR